MIIWISLLWGEDGKKDEETEITKNGDMAKNESKKMSGCHNLSGVPSQVIDGLLNCCLRTTRSYIFFS